MWMSIGSRSISLFFFFQAEDGIRDYKVTGVQTCALPITIAVFLSAYAIPVSFHTVMSVVGGNSIANTTSLTPGGIGVNQALNVASLNGVADPTTATAYSVAQQLVTTAWSQILAIVLVVWTFGWSGGRALVGESYEEAKQKTTERKDRKKERKADGR